MPTRSARKTSPADEITRLFKGIQPGPTAYANHTQVILTGNEFIIDFYHIYPVVGNLAEGQQVPAAATHVQRMVLPIALAKATAAAITNTITNFEAENNIVLSNLGTLLQSQDDQS